MTIERFQSNPFGIVYRENGEQETLQPLTKKQETLLRAQQIAWKRYYDTGDETYLVNLGVFPDD